MKREEAEPMSNKVRWFAIAPFMTVLALVQGVTLGASEPVPSSGLVVRADGAGIALGFEGGAPFHRTDNEVINDQVR